MKFEISKNNFTGKVTFTGSYEPSDLHRLSLNPIDRMLLRQPCGKASDFLLTLETLYRRHEEQQEQQDEL